MKWPLLLALISGHLNTQAQNRLEFWSRLNSSITLSQRFSIAADIQFRTQADYHMNSKNCFDHYKMYSVRPWLIYKTKTTTELLLSPIAFFRTSDYLTNSSDWGHADEVRATIGIQKTNNFEKYGLKWRLMLESRNFVYPAVTHQYRGRLQVQLKIPLIKKNKAEVGVLLSEEYFYKLFEKMDNNRIFTGVTINLKRHELQSGIQWQQLGNFTHGDRVCQFTNSINLKF